MKLWVLFISKNYIYTFLVKPEKKKTSYDAMVYILKIVLKLPQKTHKISKTHKSISVIYCWLYNQNHLKTF